MKRHLLKIITSGVISMSLMLSPIAIMAEEFEVISEDTSSDFIVDENIISEIVVEDTILAEDEPQMEASVEDSQDAYDDVEDNVVESTNEEAGYVYSEETYSESVDNTSVIAEEKDIIVENLVAEDEYSDGRKQIVSFSEFDPYAHLIEISSVNKPSLAELLEAFPDTINVRVKQDGSISSEDISVSWYCVGEDYEESEGYYFQFSPKWDESEYKLAEGLEVYRDAPYIPVNVNAQTKLSLKRAMSTSRQLAFCDSTAIQDNKEQVFRYLTNNLGLTSAAACGIMANIQYESGFKPDIYGDNGTSYGLCQWHNSRFTNLKNYCSKNGYDYTTVDGQMHFLQYELSGSYNTIYNYMKKVDNSADGSFDAGYYWCVKFEVPANKEEKGVIRGNLAKDTYWPKYGNKTQPDTPVTPDNPISGEYNITYVLNGATNNPLNPTKYSSNWGPYRLYAPTLKGFVFDGWYLDYYTVKVSEIAKGTKGDIVLWAKFSPITYKIKFYGNGSDSGSVSSMTGCKYGTAFKLNKNRFKKDDYIFDGWNTKADGSGKSYKDKASVKNLTSTNGKTIKLYAQWIEQGETKYTIKFNGNGETSGAVSSMKNCSFSEEIVLNKNHYKKKGYNFVGWNTKKSGKGTSYEDQEIVSGLSSKNGATVTLYAQWEKKE